MSSLSADIEAEAPLSRRSTIAQLRDSIAKAAAKAGDEAFLDRSLKGLGDDPSAAHQRRTRIPLGRDCRLDRLLGGGLALGTLTEIRGARPGDAAAASGFLLGLASRLAARPGKARAAVLWIVEDFAAREQGALYGAGLAFYGLDPARLILVAARGAQQALWAMEEALKCRGPAVVIGELWSAKPYDLTASRRLLLAAQRQGTPGAALSRRRAGNLGRAFERRRSAVRGPRASKLSCRRRPAVCRCRAHPPGRCGLRKRASKRGSRARSASIPKNFIR